MSEIVLLPDGATPRDVQRAVSANGFSRYVIEAPDRTPRSYLHLKDVLDLTGPEELDRPIPVERLRDLPIVAGTAELEDDLAHIRAEGAHVARVTGAGGTVTGVLFLEDILEELIGEVQDAASA